MHRAPIATLPLLLLACGGAQPPPSAEVDDPRPPVAPTHQLEIIDEGEIVEVEQEPAVEPVASVDRFRAPLDEHGDWRAVEPHGEVFLPDDPQYIPYSDGYWVHTDYGWTWMSNEPIGWAVSHYGRWVWLGDRWAWIPGTEWGPAWVVWREGDGWIGWAPLGPPGHVAPVVAWRYVTVEHFVHHRTYVYAPPYVVRRCYRRSRPVHRYTRTPRGRTYVAGPARSRFARYGRVRTARVKRPKPRVAPKPQLGPKVPLRTAPAQATPKRAPAAQLPTPASRAAEAKGAAPARAVEKKKGRKRSDAIWLPRTAVDGTPPDPVRPAGVDAAPAPVNAPAVAPSTPTWPSRTKTERRTRRVKPKPSSAPRTRAAPSRRVKRKPAEPGRRVRAKPKAAPERRATPRVRSKPRTRVKPTPRARPSTRAPTPRPLARPSPKAVEKKKKKARKKKATEDVRKKKRRSVRRKAKRVREKKTKDD